MEEAKLAIAILALITSIVAIAVSTRTAIRVKAQDVAHDRRRLFITALWDKLTAVRGINAGNATKELVLNTINTLELVALCWDEGIVDRELICRAFGDSYCQRTAEIESITQANGYGKVIRDLEMDGPTLFKYYNLVQPVREQIRAMMHSKLLKSPQGGGS